MMTITVTARLVAVLFGAIFVVSRNAGASDNANSLPPAPTNLAGTSTVSGISLTWRMSDDDGVTGYRIQRRKPEEGESTLRTYVFDTGSSAKAWTDTRGLDGVRYVYRVHAINDEGVGGRSNVANIRYEEPAPAGVPAAPTNLRGTVVSEGVRLAWGAPDD